MRGSSQPLHEVIVHQLHEFALAHHRVGEVEAVEFVLVGAWVDGQLLDEPIVEGAVGDEFQGAEAVGDAFDGIFQAVGPVVEGVDFPGVAGAVVVIELDAVHQRVAHQHVFVGHVDFGAQDAAAGFAVTGLHFAEELEVFLDAAPTEGAVDAGAFDGAAVGTDGFAVLVVDVGQALFDQQLGPGVHLLEIIRGVTHLQLLTAGEPFDVADDGIHVFDVFLTGVGVVKTQAANAVEFVGDAEVEADGFGVANVQVAVGFGRETGDHRCGNLALFEVIGHYLADKVAGWAVGGVAHVRLLAGSAVCQPQTTCQCLNRASIGRCRKKRPPMVAQLVERPLPVGPGVAAPAGR